MDQMNGYGERTAGSGGRGSGAVNLGRISYPSSSSSGSANGTSVAALLPSLTSHFQATFGHSATASQVNSLLLLVVMSQLLSILDD